MRLTRSRNDSIISGLLAGIGNYLNVDPTIVRIVVVILFFIMTPLPIIPLYIIGMVIVPLEPDTTKKTEKPFFKNKRRQGHDDRRQRMDRAFRKTDPVDVTSSRRTNTIEEDDWSDF